ncbi:hypothetical protein KI440_02025 [Candidatus Saccharibacteria bacterium TM7i]|nr:hypothetical protein KI440_02025 [Candidatus Saccharibacteria bacterium TM7i]
MPSIDERIRREARRHRRRIAQEKELAHQALREFVYDDVQNMRGRSIDLGIEVDAAAHWLHMKNYDDTYKDWSPRSKQQRTRLRIESLLELAESTPVLLKEYEQALSRYFPIRWKGYVWNPQLIIVDLPSGKQRISMEYRWRRQKSASADNAG